MSEPKTPNLGLNKIDRSSPSTTYFDLDKYLDQNWEKIDDFAEQVGEKAEETATKVSDIQERLDVEKRRAVTLEPGVQTIHAERASAFKLDGLKGRTLVNLLGRDGGFEGYSNWGIGAKSATLDPTTYAQGSYSSLKVTLASNNSNISKTVSTTIGKTYILLADVKNVSTTEAFVSISTVVNGNKATGSQFATSFAKFTATSTTHAIAVVGSGTEGQVFNVDNVRLYEISASDYILLDNMRPDQIAVKYPYVDSVQPVKNPYVIRYGENLFPPFYEMTYRSITSKIKSPYTYEQTEESPDGWTRVVITVTPQTDYHLSFSTLNNKGMMAVFSVDEKELILNYGREDRTFNSGIHTQISIYINGTRDCVDTLINPMLTIGKTEKQFEPREDVMFALQTDLYADPMTGVNSDEVFEKEGQYFKFRKWCKVVLDGSLTHSYFGAGAGFKVVNALLPLGSVAVDGSGLLTKFQGNIIKETDYATVNSGADNLNIGSSGANGVFDNFQISISNTDSGWGESYTPSTDEIKAYFMGWRMFPYEQGNTNPLAVYNGSGTKAWVQIDPSSPTGVQPGAYTINLPTLQSTNTIWTPYELLYKLATPVIEPITSEGQVTFTDGDNQVEVGTGIVLREVAKPGLYNVSNDYMINDLVYGRALSRKADKIFTVYRNSKADYKAIIFSGGNQYGNQKARISAYDYDPSASYSVTYLMLDKYPAVDITGTYAKNEKALLLDAVKTLQDNTTRISVLESKKAEKDNPAWITPTLLNGWVPFSSSSPTAQFYKDSNGVVHIRGFIKSGLGNAIVFNLPPGYRPGAFSAMPVVSAADAAGAGLSSGTINIQPNGQIQTAVNIKNGFLTLDSISFLAEQ